MVVYTWVENLCADGKLALAIERAEKNIAAAVEAGKLEEQSYSFVYKVFKPVVWDDSIGTSSTHSLTS